MVKLLVVEDSPVERRLVGAILERNIPDAIILYAEDGREALHELARSEVDLVLTDLMMPHVTGLELVEEMRAIGCHVPVILLTGFGNEDIAAQALLAGASSYIPKRALPKYLIATVKNVLFVAPTRKLSASKPAGVTELVSHFSLDNDSAKATTIVEYLVGQLRFLETYNDTQITHTGIALQEALSNAIYHGNLELSSTLRHDDDSKYYELAEVRSKTAPFQGRRVIIHANVDRNQARYVIRDAGPGFDVNAAHRAAGDLDNFDLVSGRGLLLIRSFMDEVNHNAAGNEITLVKRQHAQAERAPAIDGSASAYVAPSTN